MTKAILAESDCVALLAQAVGGQAQPFEQIVRPQGGGGPRAFDHPADVRDVGLLAAERRRQGVEHRGQPAFQRRTERLVDALSAGQGCAPLDQGVEALGLEGNLLIAIDRDDDVSALSLRNVPDVHVLYVDQLNTYDVLVSDQVVFTTSSLEVFLAGPSMGKSVKAVATESEAAE